MTRKEFEKKYGDAIGEWKCKKNLISKLDYSNEGFDAGYLNAVPSDELLQNEDFMRGYDDGYVARYYN